MLSLKVSQLVDGIEPTCSHTATLKEAFNKMREGERGYVLLMKDGSPVGILTERDLVRLVTEGTDLNQSAIKFASTSLLQIKEHRDIYYALSIMVDNGVRRLLVVDEEGRFKGTLSLERLISHIEEDFHKKSVRVRDLLLGRELIWIDENTSLSDALKFMKEKNIGALAVLEEGKPVGIITERDIVRSFENLDVRSPVGLYMSRPVVTIGEDDTVEFAVKLMEEKGIRRLVVVDKEGRALGMLSNRDIARNAYDSYWKLLETKLKHAKDILNLLPEPTFELVDLYSSQLIVWMNTKAVEVFGNRLDSNILEVIPEKDWSVIYGMLLKDKKVEKARFNAGNKTYELSGSYLSVESERTKGRIKLMLRDVTEELAIQKTMEVAIDNYQRIINSTDDMIIVYEAHGGRIKMVNRAVSRKLGYSEEELKDMTIFQIVQTEPELISQNIRRILFRDEVIRGKRVYRDAYGNSLPVEISATKVMIDQSPSIVIVARDISERMKLEEAIEKKNRELESLHDFIINLNRCSSEGEAYNLLAHVITRVVGVDTLAIYRINPSLNRVVDTLVYGNSDYVPCLENGQEPQLCKVFQSVHPFVVKNRLAYSCPSFQSFFGSYMCMSVVSGGRAIALLSMVSQQENFFDRERREFIENIVNTFSPFLSNLRLIEINKELSIRDHLTNLFNRRFVTEFFQKEIEKAKREKSSIGILLLDLDYFKKINDSYGHQVGDLCLKVFSEVLTDSVRSMDVVGRWGGEEFVIILPKVGRFEAVQVANRIREALKRKTLYSDGGVPISMTVSIGVAVFPEDGETLDELLKTADKKLYLAKEEGRDLVVP